MKVTIETDEKVVTIEGDEKEVIEEVKKQLKIEDSLDKLAEAIQKNQDNRPYKPHYPDVYPWIIKYCGYHDFIDETAGRRCRKCQYFEPYVDYTPWITWCSNNVSNNLFYGPNQIGDFDVE